MKSRKLFVERLENRSTPATFTVTNGLNFGIGSLRQALADAQTAPGADQIVFSDAVTTVNLAAPLYVRSPVTITGKVSNFFPTRITRAPGAPDFRIFEVLPGVAATFDTIRINGGVASVGGGILNRGNLTLRNLYIDSNEATAHGGAIYNDGGATLIGLDTFITDSQAQRDGGALYMEPSTVSFVRSTINGSEAGGLGGGVYSLGGSLQFTESSVASARSGQQGGGVYLAAGSLVANRSAFSSGTSNASSGGGVYIANAASVTMTNTFITGNFAKLDGGGFYNAGSLLLQNCTLTFNGASFNPTPIGTGGGVFTVNSAGANTRLVNTSVVSNRQALFDNSAPPSDLAGKNVDPTSHHNLVSDPASAGGLVHGAQGNIVGKASGANRVRLPYEEVYSLTFVPFEGKTNTILPLQNSPIINAGDNASIPVGVDTDQRGVGFARIVGGTVDIGSTEFFNVRALIEPINGSPSLHIESGWLDFDDKIRLAKSADGTRIVVTFDPSMLVASGPGVALSGNTLTAPLASFVGGRIQVSTRGGNDTVTFDWSTGPVLPAGSVFVNGGSAGTSSTHDVVRVLGRPTDILYYVAGGTTSSLENSGVISTSTPAGVRSIFISKARQVDFDGASRLHISSRLGAESLAIDGMLDAENERISRLKQADVLFSFGFLPVSWKSIATVSITEGTADTPTTVNQLTIHEGGLKSVGLKNFTYTGSLAIDRITVRQSDMALPVPGGTFTIDGGSGTKDLLIASGATSFTLNASSLIATAGGSIRHHNIERAMLTAGNGNNFINASAFAGSVLLNGGLGNDHLTGAQGRSILFGEAGADTLIGGNQDDLLLDNGFFVSDQIHGVWDEWLRTDADFITRVNHLRNGGGLNGTFLFRWPNVFVDPASIDALFGRGGTDWIFASDGDTVVQD